MFDDDFGFVLVLALFAAIIAIGITFTVKAADEDSWDKQFNGCYVHTVKHNRVWSPDTQTKALYCPTKEVVK